LQAQFFFWFEQSIISDVQPKKNPIPKIVRRAR